MPKLKVVDTFETTPLGQALVESAQIRKEMRGILDSSSGDMHDDGYHPESIIANFARERTETLRRFAQEE